MPLPQKPTAICQSTKEDANVDIDVNIENQYEEERLHQVLPDAEEEEDTQENEKPAPTPTVPHDPDGRMQPEPEMQTAPATDAAAPYDLNERMPGQLPTATEVLQNDYHSIKQRALAKVAAMVGQEVTITSQSELQHDMESSRKS